MPPTAHAAMASPGRAHCTRHTGSKSCSLLWHLLGGTTFSLKCTVLITLPGDPATPRLCIVEYWRHMTGMQERTQRKGQLLQESTEYSTISLILILYIYLSMQPNHGYEVSPPLLSPFLSHLHTNTCIQTWFFIQFNRRYDYRWIPCIPVNKMTTLKACKHMSA